MVFKVIVDYICIVVFVIGDGVLLFNEGCGYILCCLFCCVVCYVKVLIINELFMYKLVLVVGKIMNSFYLEVEN